MIIITIVTTLLCSALHHPDIKTLQTETFLFFILFLIIQCNSPVMVILCSVHESVDYAHRSPAALFTFYCIVKPQTCAQGNLN